jgi:peroxiredoxin Q/BCP
MAQGPQVGDPAPDFTLEGTDGTFTLSHQRGQRVVLLFYPGDNTAVCTRQFCSYRDNAEDFAKLDAVAIGISSQSLESHEGFRDRHGLNVPLLADEDRAVSKSYGVTGPLGVRRAVIIVDEEGVVRHRHVHTLGLTFQSVDDIAAALATLPSRAAG